VAENGSITTIGASAQPVVMPSHQLATRTSSSRQRLLAAAKKLFAAQGYEQTATSAIAREAGTSESQLMRYFGGKVGLLEALLDDAWNHLNARVERALQNAGGHRDSLLDAFQTMVAVLARDSDLATLFMFEGRRMRGDKPRVRLSPGFVAFSDTIHGLVRKAQTTREISQGFDTSAVTSALLGAVEAMIRDRLIAKSRAGRGFAEREIRRTLEGLLQGLQDPPRSGRAAAAKKR
jgi:AcrR family transcriptional regulator